VSRVLPLLLLLGFTIFTFVTVIQSDATTVRGLPRWLWAVLVLIVPVIGLAAWWIFGRPLPSSDDAQDPSRRPPTWPLAPDDDPDFLRGL